MTPGHACHPAGKEDVHQNTELSDESHMKFRGSVGRRLLLAFFGISAFAALTGSIAIYSFLTAGKTLEHITAEHVPVTAASQHLSRQAERLVTAAPVLLTVNTREEHEETSSRISAQLDELETQLGTLKALVADPEPLDLIEKLVTSLGTNLATVDLMVNNSLALAERKRELLRDLSFTDISSRRLLGPGLLVMDAKLAEIRTMLGEERSLNPPVTGEIGTLAEPIISLAPLQRALAEVSSINDLLIKAASAHSVADLNVQQFPLRRSLTSLEKLISVMDPDLAVRFGPKAEEYRGYIDGENSIISVRTTELGQLEHMQTLLAQNVDYSNRLTRSVDALVDNAKQEMQIATDQALDLQNTSTLIILIVVILSLIFSFLIVWLYVGGNLIRRLTGLSESMKSIAAGDLGVKIPDGGTDEIADMTEALVVFRNTAEEVRATNMREIQQARSRLTDAIESIGEGFCLYDREDRLVLCNSRYRTIFYPGIRDILVVGTSFETVLRTAAERGLIKEAQGREEAWIKERLKRHREASEPHLQQQSDGRWIQISEYKTETEGTVGVYTEVTELIDQAEQLESWNKELEQRVANQVRELQKIDQLRRFFPPQLADAIVSDDRGSVLEDHRREVTLIFCDLRGFTEFSSMAEPEEEMRILREYHAVVCPLIFDYGATLEHFAGDGVMSFLNDPVQHADHIHRAVEMADAMRTGMRALRNDWLKREIDMGFGVGIGTGYATLGRIGTRDLFHYAAIGSVANLAARLCDEALDGQILVPQRVYSDIEGDFEAEPIGILKLKGFPKPVPAYNIIKPIDSKQTAKSQS